MFADSRRFGKTISFFWVASDTAERTKEWDLSSVSNPLLFLHSCFPLSMALGVTIYNPLKLMGTQLPLLSWPEVRRQLGFPAEEVQDSSWQTSWARSSNATLCSGFDEGHCSQQTAQHKPPSLPWWQDPQDVGYKRKTLDADTFLWLKHYCDSESTSVFLVYGSKGSSLDPETKISDVEYLWSGS